MPANHQLPKNKTIPKPNHRKKITTVNDLLTRDDINDILANLDKVKPDIKDLLVIYVDKENTHHWQTSDSTLLSTAVLMLESTKLELMFADDD